MSGAARPADDDDAAGGGAERSAGPAPAGRADPAKDAAFAREALPSLPDVARFARSLTHSQADAEDLVQETFLRAYRAWHTYRPETGCRRWLFTICKHEFLRVRRRESRYVDADADAAGETIAAVRTHVRAQLDGTDALLLRLDLAPAIRRSLEALPPAFRAVALLVDVEGYEYEDAAELLGVPIGTVRSRLFRARRLLQEMLFAYARDAGIGPRSAAPAAPAARAMPNESTAPRGAPAAHTTPKEQER